MRSCATCGTSIDKSSLFCPACGSKVPPESRPTEAQTSVRVEHVDPLASTSPASFSPARKLDLDPYAATAPESKSPARNVAAEEPHPVSPKAGTGFQSTPPNVGVSPVAAPSAPSLSNLPSNGPTAAPALGAADAPGRPSVPKVSTRGKTAPLSAVPHLAAKLNAKPAPAAPPLPVQPQAIPAFAQPPRISPVPPVAARPSQPQSPRAAPPVALAGAPPGAFPGAFPGAPFPPGRRVLVQWANGQRYPGVVQQVNGLQCLVRFDAGGDQRWVETRYVTPVG